MIYVEMLGRMGNQLFSYALARKIQIKNPKQRIAVDFSNYKKEDNTWINYLELFSCNKNICIEKRKLNLLQRVVLHMFYKKRQKMNNRAEIFAYERKYAYYMELLGLYIITDGYFDFKYKSLFHNKLLVGWFESSLYFEDIREIILRDFKLNQSIADMKILSIIQMIEDGNSVCIGIRRGDFVSTENADFCSVCGIDYYRKSIEAMKERLKSNSNGPEWFIFSDDIMWARSIFSDYIEGVYVTSSVEGMIKPWEMLYMISKCKNFVISNSTFFWWGQYLCENSNKVVIAPSRWRNYDEEFFRDIYQNDWILIDP